MASDDSEDWGYLLELSLFLRPGGEPSGEEGGGIEEVG